MAVAVVTGYEVSSIALSLIAVVMASVVAFVYHRQLREMRRQNERLAGALRVATTDTLEEGFARVTRAFLDYPQLRGIFYEDERLGEVASPVTDDDALRANALAESILSLFSSAFRLSSEGDVDELPWFAEYVEGFILNSTYFRQYALLRQRWVDPRIVEIAERAGAARAQGPVTSQPG